MKSNLVKRLVVLAMTATLGLSMAACGAKKEEAPAVAETEAPAADAAAETPVEEAPVVEEEAPAVEEEAPAADAAATGEALTEEEYVAKANEIGNSLTQVATDLTAKAADMTDVDGAIASMEELKAPYIEFKAVVAPESCTDADAKLKSGCDEMIGFVDYMIELMEASKDGEIPDQAEMTTKMTELVTKAQTDFTEGIALLPAAK